MAANNWLRSATALVCDFDGTIARSHYDFPAMRAAAISLAAEHGVGADAFAGRFTLEGIEQAAVLLGKAGPAFRARAHAALGDYEMQGARQAELMPEAMAALRRLAAAGLRIGVITGNCRRAVEVILGGRAPAWHGLFTRDDVALPKPHAEHLQHALRALGAGPEQAIMVGDHALDIETGRRAGVRTVGVLTGAGTVESLRAAGADLVLADLAELAELLLREKRHAPD